MKSFLKLGALVMLIGVMLSPAAIAQAPEFTTWTIEEPTYVGSFLMQPGTYRISLAPSANDRNLVRIMSADGQQTLATVLTVPNYLEPGETMPTSMFVYFPAENTEPRALRTWFAGSPASGIGHDIVYDEERATLLARRAATPVVTYRGTVTEPDLVDTELYVMTPEARVETYVVPETRVETHTHVMETTPAPVAVAETRTELPETASTTPLLALLGLVAVAGAFALRIAR